MQSRLDVFKADFKGGKPPGWMLAMPARYIIGQHGIVPYSNINPDYTQRPDPSELLPVLQKRARSPDELRVDPGPLHPSGLPMTQRTFLITGASKGIGLSLSQRLAQAGHKVVGLARQPADYPGELACVDLSDRARTETVLQDLARRHHFDGVINNVGVVRPQPLGAIDLDDMDQVFALNLHPAVQAAQALLPGMREQGWGRIVNISSLTILGVPQRTAYAAAKAALVSFCRSWALELAGTGITVNAVAPGPTETELFRVNNPVGSEGERRFLAAVPMGRFGKPEEIAATIAFLLSDDAGFMTGQTLYVDGGASLGKAAF